jgi:hypothetical protein
MKYSRVCQNCLAHSDENEAICPECGTTKTEIVIYGSFHRIFIKSVADRFPNIQNAEIYVNYIVNSILLLFAILIINPLIENSDLFWIIFIMYTVQGVFRTISLKVARLRQLHIYTRIIIYLYAGAGAGNLISYTGKIHKFHFLDFFNPAMLWNELIQGNGMVIIGAVSGIILVRLFYYYINFIK